VHTEFCDVISRLKRNNGLWKKPMTWLPINSYPKFDCKDEHRCYYTRQQNNEKYCHGFQSDARWWFFQYLTVLRWPCIAFNSLEYSSSLYFLNTVITETTSILTRATTGCKVYKGCLLQFPHSYSLCVQCRPARTELIIAFRLTDNLRSFCKDLICRRSWMLW
jgi:hypothetical protein